MKVQLHANATTTHKVRRMIQESDLPTSVLAKKYGLAVSTVRIWRNRDSVEDRSHTPHRLQTTLTCAQETVVVEIRKLLLLPLDDLLAVTREFINPNVSRSGLDRCLRRHGVSRLKDLVPQEETETQPVKRFKDYDPGYLHVDYKYLPQMKDESARRYLFVAIDRATRWVYVEIKSDKSARSAKAFMNKAIKQCPVTVKTVLTDNDKCFTDRFTATGSREPTGDHVFDKLCHEHQIDHRLIKPRHPATNGMVERFNGRIAEVLNTHHFESGEELAQTLKRYVYLYNHHIPQKALDHQPPIEALKMWQKKKPELFTKRVVNHRGPDILRFPQDRS